MNERIKQIAADTDVWCDQHWAGSEFYDVQWEQKYAELIVKECIDTLEKRYMGDNNREDIEVRRCVADIQTHFGVEE